MPDGEIQTADDLFSCHIRDTLAAWCLSPQSPLNVPLEPAATPFQRVFREALLQIPAGQTVSYGELARTLRTSPRAVGQACRLNPLVLFVPCHRVVANSGLGGYMGSSAPSSVKRALLHHENFYAQQ
ncbi:methylated-DNA--[protein]-cysteine S-methyltransferase [Legionella geestiana]|nr:methylated-DNA--[protein]-cysteine S-methyltransferase [Legionella geestiana]QDQ41072.1 methylated-DNA--[protein]-cysteine S-methyltransferase [Legionella geestiana]